MYKYKIGYTSEDDSYFFELEHEEKFSKDQLTDIIIKAAKEIAPQLLDEDHKQKKYCHSQETLESGFFNPDVYLKDVIYPCHLNIISLPEWLIKNMGFKNIEYEVSWYESGWSSLIHKETQDGYVSETVDRIIDALDLPKISFEKNENPS